ncbi:hypothetical protein ACFWAY_44520 [Rhodococcus sp. NPDC059968]|uniref:hypothetical protein n=1 Tax=Rhodococcus sp. NPDC059968 TaxID=3347017 RepID=UPI00366AB4EC
MSESAGKVWLAKYMKDNRSLDRELAQQEARAKEKAPSIDDAVTHHHYSHSSTTVRES